MQNKTLSMQQTGNKARPFLFCYIPSKVIKELGLCKGDKMYYSLEQGNNNTLCFVLQKVEIKQNNNSIPIQKPTCPV